MITPDQVKDIISIAGAAGAAILGSIIGIQKHKERRARRQGLLPNPARCGDHERRLNDIEKDSREYRTDIKNLNGDIGEIKSDVKTLINLHMKE